MFRWARIIGAGVGAAMVAALFGVGPATAAIPSAPSAATTPSQTITAGATASPLYLATSYYVRVRAALPATLHLTSPSSLRMTYDPGVSCSVTSVERYASPSYVKAITWTCTRAGTTAASAGFTAAYGNVTYRFTTVFRPVNLGTTTMYSFLSTSGARWQPCYRVLRVSLNMNGVSAIDRALVLQALDQIKAATGIGYVIVAPTTMIPNKTNFGQATPGVDIVFAFARPGQSNFFTAASPGLVGQGGASTFQNYNATTSWMEFRYGKVVISTAVLTQSAATRKLVYMHELAHVLGLGHVSALGTQVMEPFMRADRPAIWGMGDRTGLAKLGAKSGCLPLPER